MAIAQKLFAAHQHRLASDTPDHAPSHDRFQIFRPAGLKARCFGGMREGSCQGVFAGAFQARRLKQEIAHGGKT